VSPAAAAGRPHLESSSGTIATGRTLASTGATGTAATATTTAASESTTAAPVSISSAATAVAPVPTAAWLGPRQEVREIVEVALLLRVRRRILAGHHAYEPHVVGAPTHHFQRLHQAREPIAFDAELLFDLCGRRCGRRHRGFVDGRRRFRRRATFTRRRLGASFRGGTGVAFRGGLATGRFARFGGRGRCGRLGGGRFGLAGSGLGRVGRRSVRTDIARLGCRRRFGRRRIGGGWFTRPFRDGLRGLFGFRLFCGLRGVPRLPVWLPFGALLRRGRWTVRLTDQCRFTQDGA
jgi:hypothetical protein